MNRGLLCGVCAMLFVWAGPVLADEAADCQAGIDAIKAELAKNPADDVKAKLTKFLSDAEREAGEKEFDECLEAVEDAKEVAGG